MAKRKSYKKILIIGIIIFSLILSFVIGNNLNRNENYKGTFIWDKAKYSDFGNSCETQLNGIINNNFLTSGITNNNFLTSKTFTRSSTSANLFVTGHPFTFDDMVSVILKIDKSKLKSECRESNEMCVCDIK